jgi:hypothetical protein
MGRWNVTLGNADFSLDTTWRITGGPGAYAGSADGEPFDRVSFRDNQLTVAMTTPMGAMDLTVTINGNSLSGQMSAQGFTLDVDGTRTSGPQAGATKFDDGGQR